MPVEALVDGCPLYDLEPGRARAAGSTATRRRSTRGRRRARSCWRCSPRPTSPPSAGPSSSTTRVVGSRTVRRPEAADAAVLEIPEAGRAIAVSIDGNGRRVACDPYAGTVEAVLECAQNLACVGAEPLGLTNCLNFGNPEKPAVAWQLDRSVEGLADACEALGVPVVGGNVSLYNETGRGPDLPDAGRRHGRRAARPRRGAGASRCATGDAIALARPVPPALAGLGAGEAARRARTAACPSADIAAVAAAQRGGPRGGPRGRRSASATTSATAASPARSPRWRSPAGSAPRSTSPRWSREAARRGGAVRRGAGRLPARGRARGARGARGRRDHRRGAAASAIEIAAGDAEADVPVPRPSRPGARCPTRWRLAALTGAPLAWTTSQRPPNSSTFWHNTSPGGSPCQ